ncbi:MAG TPA: hydrogenase nickel incorporation protein HypB [Streptosporangiaceae bacterium]|nr:hydrogenase nickel incorporation protein HypB [Streptosporangiaceae bacterium]
MCATCGCSGTAVVRLFPADWASHVDDRPRHERAHRVADHDHDHHDHQDHDHQDHDHRHGTERILRLAEEPDERTIRLEQKVLAKNDRLAELNREWLRQRSVLAVNLMSSPGAGKTTLLERTARELAGKVSIMVIEGDQAAALDATRIRAAGCKVVQINTGAGCHLDAEMVAQGLRALDPPGGSVVMIENVGNLVCPSLFDLGEQSRVVLASVTEGDDKPLKYPHMFRRADLILVSKTDLLPYVDFDSRRHASDVRKTSPDALMLQVSAATGAGMQEWYDWLRRRILPPED